MTTIRRNLTLTITSIAVVFSAFLGAQTSNAAMERGHFTLNAAYQADVQFESGLATVTDCRVVDAHHDTCVATTPLEAIASYISPVQLTWTDNITRSGPCPLPVTHPGVSSGSDRNHRNCFNGPLAVAVEDSTIQILDPVVTA